MKRLGDILDAVVLVLLLIVTSCARGGGYRGKQK